MKILGGGPNHRRPADINVLDQFLECDSRLGGGLFEGVEVDHHHVDGGNVVLGDGGDVLGVFPAMQDASVHFGMQRLDPPVEHFGEAGKFSNVFDRDA